MVATTTTVDLTTVITQSLSMTTELYVKTCTAPGCHGVIWSYATKKTFAVWNKGTVVITFDLDTWDTGLTLEDNEWNQISLVWTLKEKKLEVYVYNSKGNLIAEPFSHGPIRPNPFKKGGKLALGRWQTSSRDNGNHASDTFVGCIDELRIWKK